MGAMRGNGSGGSVRPPGIAGIAGADDADAVASMHRNHDLDQRRSEVAQDPRTQELTELLREFYDLCDRSPHAAELCRLWSRSRRIAADVEVEWEPVGTLRNWHTEDGAPDDPAPLVRALRGLLRSIRGDQKMVARLLARALHELVQLWQLEPLAADLCRRWDRCHDLAEQLSTAHGVRVTFRDADEWKTCAADRGRILEQPWIATA